MSAQTITTDDNSRYVRISVTELRAYIARDRELHELKLRLNMTDIAATSAAIIADANQSILSPQPARTITPVPQAGGVQAPVAVNDQSFEIHNDTQSEPVITIYPERQSILEQSLSITPMPEPTGKFTLADGQTKDIPVHKSRVPYGTIIENVIELIKLQRQADGKQLFLPALMTPTNVKIVMDAVELGVSRKRAVALVGIAKTTYDFWKRNANEGREPYVSFYNLFDLAEARTEVALVAAWRAHANANWQAAESFLKRRLSDDWGDKPALTLSAHDIAKMSIEEIETALGKDAIDIIDGEIMNDDIPAPQLTDDDYDSEDEESV